MNAFRINKLDIKDQQDHLTSHLAEVVASALRFRKGQVGGGDAPRVGISVGQSGDNKVSPSSREEFYSRIGIVHFQRHK